MKNKEKYAKEIMEVACSGDSIAVTKGSERIVKCGSIACSECLFAPPNCVKEIREWVEQEYIEKPVISKRDRAFLEYFREERRYIARDKNGKVFVYETQPRKGEKYWNGENTRRNFNLGGALALDTSMLIFQWSNGQISNRGLSRT